MYIGEPQSVILEFSGRVIGVMYDKFGEGLKIKRISENVCRAKVEVHVSPTFWSWLFMYPKDIHLVEPRELVSEYISHIKTVLNRAYQDVNEYV